MSHKFMRVLLLSLVAGVGVATANGLQNEHQDVAAFSGYDLNNDGVISRTEAATEAELRQTWRRLDQNLDDQVDQGEFARFEVIQSPVKQAARSSERQ